MKMMTNTNSSRNFGHGIGYIILMVVFLSILSFPAGSALAYYEGAYSGSYSGDDNGIWIAYIQTTPSNYIWFITWSTDNASVDGGEGNDVNDSTGNIDLITYDGSAVTGYIDATTFDVAGTWSNSPDSGIFSGTRQDPTLVDDYQGNYSGKFCGDSSGTWDITVEVTGYIFGTATPSGGSTFPLEGGVNADGDFILYAYGEDGAIRGTIQSDGDVTGYWRNEYYDENGWISNKTTCGPITSALGGSGAGCFISILQK